MENSEKISRIEDVLNRLGKKRSSPITAKIIFDDYDRNSDGSDITKDEAISKIDRVLKTLSNGGEDMKMIEDYMRKLGSPYMRKDGSLDFPKFQTDACIGQSVWSRFERSDQKRSSQETILKIIIALKMPIKDAEKFMNLRGTAFSENDMVDQLIKSYILNDYLGDDDIDSRIRSVSFIIEYYSEQEVKKGKKPLKNLYAKDL